MKIKNIRFHLAMFLSLAIGFAPMAAMAAPTPDDYWVFNQASNDHCVNILISTEDGANKLFIYNGEAIKTPAEYDSISNVAIYNNHIGYIAWKSAPGGGTVATVTGDVLVDNKQVGTVVDWSNNNPAPIDFPSQNYQLKINDNHVAYLKFVGMESISAAKAAAGFKGQSVFHMIFDGKDLGEVGADHYIKMNGNYIIYVRKINNKWHVFANEKDLGVGISGDFDGKNKAVIQENGNLIYDGKKLTNLGGSGSNFGAVELKNGLLAYNKGPDSSPSVFFKGKKIGYGRLPRIENNKLAYLKGTKTLVFGNKSFINLVGGNDLEVFSLAGKHFAFTVKGVDNKFANINIDGETYSAGGDYDILSTKIQISEKPGCVEP